MDFFFERSAGDMPEGLNNMFLAHPVHPGRGLFLLGRIPPAIMVNDGLGCGEVASGSVINGIVGLGILLVDHLGPA